MLERERRATIARLLESKRFVSVHDVVRSTGASQSTVRRDFADLESARNSVFYAPVGSAGRAFMEIEKEAFRLISG